MDQAIIIPTDPYTGYYGGGGSQPNPATVNDTVTGNTSANASIILQGVANYAWILGAVAFGYGNGASGALPDGRLIVRQLNVAGSAEDFKATNVPVTALGAGLLTLNKQFAAGRSVEIILTADAAGPTLSLLSAHLTPSTT